jgi:hypothetical protein
MAIRAEHSQVLQAMIVRVAIDVIELDRRWFTEPFSDATATAAQL